MVIAHKSTFLTDAPKNNSNNDLLERYFVKNLLQKYPLKINFKSTSFKTNKIKYFIDNLPCPIYEN